MRILLQDLRFSLRMLRKSRGFALATILTLAVAIGANTVALGAFDALILRPLNVPHAESLYEVGRANQENESYPSYLDLRDRNRSFEGLAAAMFAQEGLDTGDGASQVWGYKTSGNYFDVLGIQPALGRFFHASDENGPNSAPYMVLTYAYWHTHFHDDHGVVGRSVRLNKHPVTVIGVAPPGFRGTLVGFSPSFFIPIVMSGRDVLARGNRAIDSVIGHLKAGITPTEAIADLTSIGSWLHKTYPQNESQAKFRLGRPGFGDLFGGAIRGFLGGLVLLAALILLSACANLGSLFTARANDRSREIAIRLALGGAPAARTAATAYRSPLDFEYRRRRRTVGERNAVGMAWRMAAIFPEFPIRCTGDSGYSCLWHRFAVGDRKRAPLRHGAHQAGARRRGLRDHQVGIQVHAGAADYRPGPIAGSADCNLCSAGDVVHGGGPWNGPVTRAGFDPRSAMLVRIDPTLNGYKGDEVPAMQQRMLDAVEAIPGVISVGLVGEYPPLHMGWNNKDVFTERTTDLRPANAAAHTIVYEVSTGYFRAAGTALLSGRPFTLHDDQNSPRAGCSEPGIRAQGVRLLDGRNRPLLQSAGRNPRTGGGYCRGWEVYGEPGRRSAGSDVSADCAIAFERCMDCGAVEPRSAALAAAIRGQLRNVDAALPVFMQTWDQEMTGALFAPRMAALSLGVLGLMGGVLLITGIFGMAAYSVSQRKRELAIRITLGATRNEILRTALGRAVKLLASGSAAGLIFGFLASRVLAAIVYQATPRDPVVLAGMVLVMATLGLTATWIPAQRTLSLDPMILLREE